MNNFSVTGIYTDLYQLTMSQVHFLAGADRNTATFDYFFRKLPFHGGYTIFAGLADVLSILTDLRFTDEDIRYLKEIGLDKNFADSLLDFRFRGTVYSVDEGEVIFPNEPVIRVEGNLIEAQIIETVLLNVINFQSLVATKASRMRQAAGNGTLSDFGLRRAQGFAALQASRACIIGGFNSTSNVMAGRKFNVPVAGTMAHAFIQSHDDELTAFRQFAEYRPEQCVLLVDTFDTLRSGVPNAITVGLEMKARGEHLQGIRLDSGDLAYLSKHARQMLDDAGLHEVRITASNQLDEFVIKSLIEQKAPIDVFGVGTSVVTGAPDAALDGVYKLATINGQPRIKLSENTVKVTLPGKKQIHRMMTDDGFAGDLISLDEENSTETMFHLTDFNKKKYIRDKNKVPLLSLRMRDGILLGEQKTVGQIAAFSRERLRLLPAEHKRFDNPHIYTVGISERLRDQRDQLLRKHRQ